MLGAVYTKHQRQRRVDAYDTAHIEKNRVAPKWVTTPLRSDCVSIDFNKSYVGSVMVELTALMLMFGVNGSLVYQERKSCNMYKKIIVN